MGEENPANGVATSNSGVKDPFLVAYQEYAALFEAAWQPEEIQQRGAAAQQSYTQALEAISQLNIQRQAVAAWESYVQIIQDALSERDIQGMANESYLEYLSNLQQAWVSLDLTELDPQSLLAIGQSITGAAWLAAAVNGIADTLDSYQPEGYFSGMNEGSKI